MKIFILLIISAVILSLSACYQANTKEECKDPVPLKPTFTQDKYQVHVGDTVHFTYTGPVQPAGVSYHWSFEGGVPETEYSQNATVVYVDEGSFDVTLSMENCNSDKPFITISPAVTVLPH